MMILFKFWLLWVFVFPFIMFLGFWAFAGLCGLIYKAYEVIRALTKDYQ
jgi:hypothetical protein